jgi:chaperonin GroEL
MTQEIEKNAIAIKSNDEIRNIATVSASGNKDIGELIAQAMEKVGKNGVITLEESKGTETSIEIVEGMQFDRGWFSPYFCSNADKMTVEMEGADILLVDKKIGTIHELLPILQQSAASGKWLLIIAEDFEGDVLSTLVVNKLKGTLKVAAVKAPGFGDRKKAMLEDIAILTGAQVVAEETGLSLKEVSRDVLGSAEKIVITKEHTTLIGGRGSDKAIKARIGHIEKEISKTTNSYEKEKLEERKAKLGGGVAVIKIGAYSEPEMKQKKQVFEDALSSTKAAVEEGIVPGGGVALLRASRTLSQLKLEGDEAIGAKIVMMACEAPVKQIANNTGVDGSVVLSEVLSAKPTFGFNALTEKVEDLLQAGVIDPAKVVKYALMFAASVAGIVLISEALIADAKEEK